MKMMMNHSNLASFNGKKDALEVRTSSTTPEDEKKIWPLGTNIYPDLPLRGISLETLGKAPDNFGFERNDYIAI